LDEVWSFVFVKTAKYWLWTALCRRTRQIVAFVIGDHGAKTCQCLWNKIPEAYRTCHTFSDFWHAYQKVFPEETHRSVGKDSGETNHDEIVASYDFLMQLRLQNQIAAIQAGRAPANIIHPGKLGYIQQELLKQAFAQIAAVQKKVSYDFLGGVQV
jgi:IS1 family transposase